MSIPRGIRVKVAIMSAYLKPRPDRQAQGRERAAALGDFCAGIITRPAPLPITSRAAWSLLLETDATHGAVINDDSETNPTFEQDITDVCTAYPDRVIGLCYQRVKPAQAALPAGLVQTRGLLGQGILAPVEVIRDFLEWEQRYILPSYVHDDGRWQFYLYFHKLYALAPVPSFVRHDTTLPSSLGHHNPDQPGRNTYAFKDSPDPIDWGSVPIVKDPTPVWSTGAHGQQLALLRRILES